MSVPSSNEFSSSSPNAPELSIASASAVAPVAAPSVAAPSVAPVFNTTPVIAQRSSWWREMSPAGRWSVGGLGSVLALLVIAGGVAAGTYISWRNQNRIAPNVSIQGVPVGGMSMGQAKSAIYRKFYGLKVRLKTPQKTYALGLRDMGGRLMIDRAVGNAFWKGRSQSLPANALAVWKARSEPTRLALGIKWDKTVLRRKMAMVSRQYRREPRDARLRFADVGLAVVPEVQGRAINAGATLMGLQKNYRIGRDRVAVAVVPVRPRVTSADLAGHDVELGHYTTDFDSGLWGRTRNIHVAADSINGRVLMPGEKFSFNTCTGERTWDKGYRMGHIFQREPGASESKVVDGLAGGVCQVSSTAFNAIRKANQKLPEHVYLRINEQNHHSLPVSYVPSGLDATVAWPDKDFQFSNTLGHPVYVRAIVHGDRLTVSVWGRIPDSAGGPFSIPPTKLAQAPRTTS